MKMESLYKVVHFLMWMAPTVEIAVTGWCLHMGHWTSAGMWFMVFLHTLAMLIIIELPTRE